MVLVEKLILLRGVSLFQKISDELLAELASSTTEEQVKLGHTIINKNEIGDTLYIIAEGRVAVKDEKVVLAELSAKEIFGELAVLSPEPRIASVVALEDTLLLKLQRHQLIDHVGMDINLAMGIIQELCTRIRSMAKQIHELL